MRDVRCNKRLFFIDMAAFVKTKNDRQCKSRYQKKESQLLRELDFCPALVAQYVASKRDKNCKSARRRRSPLSTQACVSVVKPDDAPAPPLRLPGRLLPGGVPPLPGLPPLPMRPMSPGEAGTAAQVVP